MKARNERYFQVILESRLFSRRKKNGRYQYRMVCWMMCSRTSYKTVSQGNVDHLFFDTKEKLYRSI